MGGAKVEIFMALAGKEAEAQRRNVISFADAADAEILDLTRAVSAGDDSATRIFFERYCDRLFRYLLVVARGDEEVAREALSMTMIKAIRHMKAMRSEADVWRWLTRLAWTTFVDHCRKKARRIVTISDALSGQQAAERAIDGTSELKEALAECLHDLPPGEREIVERFYLDEQSQAEIATEAGSTRKAIESRLARIRQKLRAAILRKMHES
jgi:RNA polymerase sigma factor (sigma-70 family)